MQSSIAARKSAPPAKSPRDDKSLKSAVSASPPSDAARAAIPRDSIADLNSGADDACSHATERASGAAYPYLAARSATISDSSATDSHTVMESAPMPSSRSA